MALRAMDIGLVIVAGTVVVGAAVAIHLSNSAAAAAQAAAAAAQLRAQQIAGASEAQQNAGYAVVSGIGNVLTGAVKGGTQAAEQLWNVSPTEDVLSWALGDSFGKF